MNDSTPMKKWLESNKKIILVIGPESSATRAFSHALNNHSSIYKTAEPVRNNHSDILDEFWLNIETEDLHKAKELFPEIPSGKIILTRRSIPHGLKPGMKAIYKSCPKLQTFKDLCDDLQYQILLIITSRSLVPNLISWSSERSSANGSFSKAFVQYQMAYREIFKFIEHNDLAYLLVSAESLSLDQEDLIKSIYSILGFSEKNFSIKAKPDLNFDRYKQYFALRNQKAIEWPPRDFKESNEA